MPQKFFDIIPPEENAITVKPVKIKSRAFFSEEKIEIKKYSSPQERQPEPEITEEKKIKFSFKKIFFIFFIFCVLAGAFAFFNYYKKTVTVEVKIWPKIESVSFKEEILADEKVSQTDISKKTFLGKVITEKISGSGEFKTTGKALKEEKATGTIRIYNAYSTSPQILVAQTRFISSEGKTFKLLEKTTIPGASYDSKNKIVSGFADVKIQAAGAGEEYNIGPSTFSIPGFAGTPKYTSFYGKSTNSMAGGSVGEKSQLTSADIDKAKSSLTEKMKKDGKESLKAKISSDYILLNDSLTYSVLNDSASVVVGSFADSFIYKEDLKTEGLAIKKNEINSYINNIVNEKISGGKKIKERSLSFSFTAEKKQESKTHVSINVLAKVYTDVNLAELKKAIAGKSFGEIKIILNDNLQLSKMEIKNSIFWNRNIPENLDNIKITSTID